MIKSLWMKINDEMTEVHLDNEQVRRIFEAALRDRIDSILFDVMSADYEEDDYPGLSSLIISDDVTAELTDEILREAEPCINRLAHDAVDRLIDRHTQDYTVRLRAVATVRALTEEAALEVAEQQLEDGEISFEDTEWDVL